MSRAKYWCFTINNYSDNDFDLIKGLAERSEVTYVICGRERGVSGTPHLQGYIELERRLRLSKLKRLPGLRRGHFEPRRGTQAQAIEYCKKEDEDFFEAGTPTQVKKGQRTDLDEAIDLIRSGCSLRELWEAHPKVMIRHEKGMRSAMNALRPVKAKKVFPLDSFPWNPLVLPAGKSWILWGASGIGKTSYVRSRFPDFLWVTLMIVTGKRVQWEHFLRLNRS